MNNPFVVRFELAGRPHGSALIASDDSIWIAVNPRWYDLATWLWWWLCPSHRRARIVITLGEDNVRVRTKAVKIADRYAHIKGVPQPF